MVGIIIAIPAAPWVACSLQKYDLAVALNHDMLAAYELRANRKIEEGKFEDAIKDIEFVLKKDPTQDEENNGRWIHERPEAFLNDAIVNDVLGNTERAVKSCQRALSDCAGLEKSQRGYNVEYTNASAALLRGKQLQASSDETAAKLQYKNAVDHFSTYLKKVERVKASTELSDILLHGRALLGRAAAYERLNMPEQAAKDRAAAEKLGVYLDSHFSVLDWHT